MLLWCFSFCRFLFNGIFGRFKSSMGPRPVISATVGLQSLGPRGPCYCGVSPSVAFSSTASSAVSKVAWAPGP